MDYSEINIKTTSDVTVLRQEIDLLLNSLYHSDIEKILKEKVRASTAELIGDKREQELNSYLEGLLDYLSGLPVVELALAYEPTPEHIAAFSEWFRGQSKSVILNLRHDPSLIGGATISANGKYRDYSIRNYVKTIIQPNS